MGSSAGMQLPSLKGLQTRDQMELLDIVDSLRAEGLGEITALPQLIVCGDQSSGKSSVLEAISGIPFPRKENTCTRFATEVILRRSPESSISVSVVPSIDRKNVDRKKLLEFRHQLSTPDDFPDLFEKAKNVMLDVPDRSFSKDILRIEFCGPSQPQLTLVDLPGLIHSHIEAEHQTPEDVELVTELVSKYLKSPRSIILAIVSAIYDINLQVILNRAREVDPQGLRTLGIITKADTLLRGSEKEKSIIKLAKNERVKFRLGWHVVKNLDSAHNESLKSSLETRNTEEKAFFKDSDFKILPSYNLGIESLRAQLSKVLFKQIRLELPRLVKDIEQRITTNRAAKDKLGPSRASIDDQRAFLIQLSQSFQTICQAAVRGDYDNDFFRYDELRGVQLFGTDKSSEKRLCANLMNEHFGFAENLRVQGCEWDIVKGNPAGRPRGAFDFGRKWRTREEAIASACRLLKRGRGRELPGLPNPLLVGELFREYSRPWETLARAHIKNTWDMTNKFLELVLHHLTDDDVCEKLLRLWLEPIMAQKLETAYGKLDELLEVHKEHPFTTNHYFIDNRKKLQQKDTKDEIQKKLESVTKTGQMLSVEQITNLMKTMNSDVNADMDMIAAEDAYDNMMAYYKVALKLFMDNVPTLAIQAPIVRKLDEALCPTTVFRMSPELVTKIAGESEEKMHEREEILSKLSILEAGAQICKQYAMRPQPSATTPSNKPSEAPNPPSSSSSGTTPSSKPSEAPNPPSSSSSGTSLFEKATPAKWPFGSFESGTPSSSSRGTGSSGAPSGGLFNNISSTLPPGTGLFGSSTSGQPPPSQTSQSGFGGFGGFGQTSSSLFSSAPKPTSASLFGASKPPPSSLFGDKPKTTEVEAENKTLPWQPILPVRLTMSSSDSRPVSEHGYPGQIALYTHISAMDKCENYSVEELRLSDRARSEEE